MSDPEETGDPEWFEYGTFFFFAGAIVLAILLAIACCLIGSCLSDADDGDGETDPCCGLQGCFKSCGKALWRTLCCCCSRGAKGAADAADAATTAADELADDERRRPGGAYDECCGCGDCWKTLTCGLMGGGKGGATRRRRGRGMPPPVRGSVAQPVDDKGSLAEAQGCEASAHAHAPLLAVRVSGAARA